VATEKAPPLGVPVKLTEPVGATGLADVSVTVTVHEEANPIVTGEEHETIVVVGKTVDDTVTSKVAVVRS